MICPYNQTFAYSEQINILDEERPDIFKKHVTLNMWKNMECQEEKCAVWRDGRCCYNC